MSPEEFKRRTFDYGVRVVRLVQALPKGDAPRDLGRQLLRCGISVGANYRAAARARSRPDFISKMGIVEEECDESLCWIEMLIELGFLKAKREQPLYSEGSELLSMVVSSIITARQRPKPFRSRGKTNTRSASKMASAPIPQSVRSRRKTTKLSTAK